MNFMSMRATVLKYWDRTWSIVSSKKHAICVAGIRFAWNQKREHQGPCGTLPCHAKPCRTVSENCRWKPCRTVSCLICFVMVLRRTVSLCKFSVLDHAMFFFLYEFPYGTVPCLTWLQNRVDMVREHPWYWIFNWLYESSWFLMHFQGNHDSCMLGIDCLIVTIWSDEFHGFPITMKSHSCKKKCNGQRHHNLR